MMNKVCDDLQTMGKVDVRPNLRGKRISMTLSPLPKQQQERKFNKHLEHLSEEALEADEGDVDEHPEDHTDEDHVNEAVAEHEDHTEKED